MLTPLNADTFAAELRPYLSPQDVEAAGDFLLLGAYVRPKLDELLSGREIIFIIELLNPATAARRFSLALDWSQHREAIVELATHAAPVGPCFLQGRVLNPELGVWSICGRGAADEVYDPLGDIPEYHLPAGTAPAIWV